eukprot:2404062-Prymnesium_polylepis.1
MLSGVVRSLAAAMRASVHCMLCAAQASVQLCPSSARTIVLKEVAGQLAGAGDGGGVEGAGPRNVRSR